MKWSFPALGTHWWVEIIDNNPNITQLKPGILIIVQEFEKNYSRFMPTSLISSLNNSKALKNAPQELQDMLKYSADIHIKTDRVFNITVGSQLEKDGYGQVKDLSSKIALETEKHINIDQSLIRLSETTRIDLGGIGKGWLIDKLADYLKASGISDFIINGGGDIYVASNDRQAIKIKIEHPTIVGQSIGTIFIKNGGLASSSAQKRKWTTASGKITHHIINPATNKAQSKLASIHIYAKTTTLADVLATVFLLIDERKRQELSKKFNVSYLAINHDLSFYKSPGFPAEML
ncbi:MAG: FAD:protein FMN transferase [Bdellovibrionales bacterium]